jgi:hypothetical protein
MHDLICIICREKWSLRYSLRYCGWHHLPNYLQVGDDDAQKLQKCVSVHFIRKRPLKVLTNEKRGALTII